MEKYSIVFINYFSKIHATPKRHNRVYKLSSKHIHRPRRARVVSQLFYNNVHITPTDNTAEKFHSH